ncbi:urea amidolyase associated protein UAAP1 [Fictibacillus sp. S7]|uniref:urea amidolyase associated protein UAAP1 n=1 Tax=Fictibacillus sp. S7 TaxID=2212476 RepID=UPI0010136507|nr:urea amidolyase associated protein UAAP1 [Fictibacillus sp. S7]RXZ01401.1 urea carboxylase [Fictibacillus sp. S7]
MMQTDSYVIPAGGKWSVTIQRGKQITFTALGDGANVSLLLYNASNTAERYNMPDTLKAQHTSHLTAGHVLMSDNGRVMASITEDSLGWHDPLSGYVTRKTVDERFGKTSYQKKRNDWYRSGDENFKVELFRQGMTVRDLVPVVNLFSKVFCNEDGELHFVPGHSKKGDVITLRTEMDVILMVSNTPNPLDSSSSYPSVPIELLVTDAAPVAEDDPCVNHCPENRRAFENTWKDEKLTKGGIA